MKCFLPLSLAAGFLTWFGGIHVHAANPLLKLQPNDHIALIGNALADRMQHDGWFETYLVAKHPRHDLVFRNLAVAGDEIDVRHRSANFGTPDEWLTKVGADVVFAYFGFNESFAGEEGLTEFRSQLDAFIKKTKEQNYSGDGSPQLVLFSPIANERHPDPNFPDPGANNRRIEMYTAAMAEVARENNVPFVDLYHPSRQMYAEAHREGEALTVNGLHLNARGNRQLAEVMYRALLATELPSGDFQALHTAIHDKNEEWHSRYRTVDGFNVYGGRSQLTYESPQGGSEISNYKVMQEEMTQRDVLTANRDKRVWAVAKGNTDYQVDDSNLPPVTEVQSNKLGPNPDGSFPFLSGEEAMEKMTVHDGMEINLYADEGEFPHLRNPVQMAWDTQGRLWVAVWPNYPERRPTSQYGDKLLIFEDTDGDGHADKSITFLDDLNAPTGFQFYKDGVLVVQAPDLWFVRDTDGDDRADSIQRILMGLDSADSHHTANALALDPGGAVYLSDGVFHRTQVERANGPLRNNDGAIYRFEPGTGRFSTYVAYGFANPHGRVFDRWHNDIITDATGNANYFGAAFSGHIDYPQKHTGMNQFWDRPSRPCAGTGLLSSQHFPEEFQGNFLNCNVISFQAIFRVNVTEEGSGITGETVQPLVHSEDPNFRPVDVSVGSDGAVYFLDWHNPIIGHMQHHLRDPNRDKAHGRIYRITYKDRPLVEPAKIDGQPIPHLLDLLKDPDNHVRERAKIELGERETDRVLDEVERWMNNLDKNHPSYEHHLMETLWVHQWHHRVNPDLLKRMLQSPEHRARAAAARVLCYWRDRVPNSLGKFARLANDPHPRVRLEAVRAASFYDSAEAVNVALQILKHPTDYYLDYTLKETMRQLDSVWRNALQQGEPIAVDNAAGIDYLLDSIPTAQLHKLPRTEGVLQAILTRDGISDADRAVALAELAQKRNTGRASLLLSLLEGKPGKDPSAAGNLARQLPWLPAEELKPRLQQLDTLTGNRSPATVRPAAWAAKAVADGSFEGVWSAASSDPATLSELLNGIPLLLDPVFRAKAYDRVQAVLTDLPAGWKKEDNQAQGRFVRIELPRRGTLTLAEVEVISGGSNIAPKGKATQSSTAHGGHAERAIDGGTGGSYGSDTQTHTKENSRNPWWELDLGREYSIESVRIWNRTDGTLGDRLEGYTLTVLDSSRREVFRKQDNPAPQPKIELAVGSDPVGNLRRAAIAAIVSMGTQSEKTFGTLADLIQNGIEIPAAARGIRTLPRDQWPSEAGGTTAKALVDWARSIPVASRTSQQYVETVQTAEELAGLLPTHQASSLRRQLSNLRVAVFVIRTVREQMRYDTPRLVVEAGKPFEIILVNDDFMPHNLVVTQPGGRSKIGPMADTMKPDELDSQGRAFIPDSDLILAATQLLEPGMETRLQMTAPKKEGNYDYVCTFPGHWTLMWGDLIVTKDVESYLKEHPVAKNQPAQTTHKHTPFE